MYIHHGCDLLQRQVLVRLVGLIDITRPQDDGFHTQA